MRYRERMRRLYRSLDAPFLEAAARLEEYLTLRRPGVAEVLGPFTVLLTQFPRVCGCQD